MIDAAPNSPWHLDPANGVHDALVFDRVRDMSRSSRFVFVDVLVMPGSRVTVTVETALETTDTGLPVMIVLHIFFT